MTALCHNVRHAGSCYQQGQQRCVAMWPVVSVWTKKTGSGNQN
jgi:hypothetical protein